MRKKEDFAVIISHTFLSDLYLATVYYKGEPLRTIGSSTKEIKAYREGTNLGLGKSFHEIIESALAGQSWHMTKRMDEIDAAIG